MILWFDKLDYVDSLTSSFINRNSYATYAGLGLMATLGGDRQPLLHRGGFKPPASAANWPPLSP